MNKLYFIKELARRLGCTNVAAKAFVKTYNQLVVDTISEGEEVQMQYFGKFVPYHQPKRPGRDPRNGEEYEIPERLTIKFKISEYALRRINGEQENGEASTVGEENVVSGEV